MSNRRTAALYIRCSTSSQVEEGSHENQRDKLVDWAEGEGYDYQVFEDLAESGGDIERAAYSKLMNSLDQYDVVAVRELSRLGRSMNQLTNDLEEFDSSDVDFVTLNHDIDTTSAQGRLMFNIFGAFAEFQRDLASEHAEEAIERRKAEGKHVGRPPKLSPSQRQQVVSWRHEGMTYPTIRALVEERMNIEVSTDTLQRYYKWEVGNHD